jgi:outer membrane protein assembly factor BamB
MMKARTIAIIALCVVDGAVAANETDRVVWTYNTASEVEAKPAVFDSPSGPVVYFGDWDHSIFAIDGNTGRKEWKFLANDMIRANAAIGVDALGSPRVYEHVDDGFVYCFNGTDGSVLWQQSTGEGFGHFTSSSPVLSESSATDGAIYYGTVTGQIQALDTSTGALLWASVLPDTVFASPYLDGASNTLFVGCDDRRFYALDAATGAIKWKYFTSVGVAQRRPWALLLAILPSAVPTMPLYLRRGRI